MTRAVAAVDGAQTHRDVARVVPVAPPVPLTTYALAVGLNPDAASKSVGQSPLQLREPQTQDLRTAALPVGSQESAALIKRFTRYGNLREDELAKHLADLIAKDPERASGLLKAMLGDGPGSLNGRLIDNRNEVATLLTQRLRPEQVLRLHSDVIVDLAHFGLADQSPEQVGTFIASLLLQAKGEASRVPLKAIIEKRAGRRNEILKAGAERIAVASTVVERLRSGSFDLVQLDVETCGWLLSWGCDNQRIPDWLVAVIERHPDTALPYVRALTRNFSQQREIAPAVLTRLGDERVAKLPAELTQLLHAMLTPGLADRDINGVDVTFAAVLKAVGGEKRTVNIVVLDAGFDLDHPTLRDNLWTNPNEIPGDGIDNGLQGEVNGLPDDVHGWDFFNEDNDLRDGTHGTHVAGIATWGTDAIKLISARILGNRATTYGDVRAAIDYAAKNGARVINMSFRLP